jgi:hypothetical protein
MPTADYIIKPLKGSFGKGILGPFRPGVRGSEIQPGDSFKEQFVQGVACKIWYWDSEPVAFIPVKPPTLFADGRRTISSILESLRGNFDVPYTLDKSEEILNWQGYSSESIPPEGAKVQLDFLYGHAFERVAMDDPDRLALQSQRFKTELSHIGRVLHAAIPAELRAGTLFTLDGVLDADDSLWLLEMNCHTVIHPNAYGPMLQTCLARP